MAIHSLGSLYHRWYLCLLLSNNGMFLCSYAFHWDHTFKHTFRVFLHELMRNLWLDKLRSQSLCVRTRTIPAHTRPLFIFFLCVNPSAPPDFLLWLFMEKDILTLQADCMFIYSRIFMPWKAFEGVCFLSFSSLYKHFFPRLPSFKGHEGAIARWWAHVAHRL